MADRVLTDKQKAFLSALGGVAKGNIRQAMRIAEYSDTMSVGELVRSLSAEIKQVAEELLAASSIKAVFALDDTLDNPGRLGAQHATNAAKELLDRVGIVKKEKDTNTVKADVVFILPAKGSVDE